MVIEFDPDNILDADIAEMSREDLEKDLRWQRHLNRQQGKAIQGILNGQQNMGENNDDEEKFDVVE